MKKQLIKVCIIGTILLSVGGWFHGDSKYVVAQETPASQNGSSQTQDDIDNEESAALETIDLLIRFLSRAWIIPASVAGELMTNKVIYGEAFFLSEVLFRFWQLIRTLSLYALGFLVLYKVGETYVKGGGLSGLGNTALKAMIAGVLIPMSWWMIAATIDLSIIATAAVSSLPLNAMGQLWTELKLEGKISCSKTVYIKDFQIQPEKTDTADNTQELTFTDLVPAGDSVAGSMVFLGCGLLRLDQSFHLVNTEDTGNQTADMISSTFIRLITTLMLVLPMFVLVVVNIIRIVYIWLWIVTIPFIVLAYTFDLGKIKEMEYFKIGNIVGLIFQPVVVVGTLSAGVLIIMGMYGAMLGDEATINQGMGEMINVSIDSDNSARVGEDGPAETIFDAEIFGQAADLLGGGIGRLIVTFFMIFLFWSLVKIGFSTSAITKGVSESIFKFGEQIASTVPIVPVPGLGFQSASSIQKAKQQLERSNPYDKKIRYEGEEIANMFKSKLGITDPTLTETDFDELKGLAIQGGTGFWQTLKTKQIDEEKPINLERMKTPIAEWVVKNATLAQQIFGRTALPSAITVPEVMKLWNSGNDDQFSGELFRKKIDGILAARISGDMVTPDQLKTISPRNAELSDTYR